MFTKKKALAPTKKEMEGLYALEDEVSGQNEARKRKLRREKEALRHSKFLSRPHGQEEIQKEDERVKAFERKEEAMRLAYEKERLEAHGIRLAKEAEQRKSEESLKASLSPEQYSKRHEETTRKARRAFKRAQERLLLKKEDADIADRNLVYRDVNDYETIHRKETKEAPKGVFLSCQRISKIYSNRVEAVHDFSLDVNKGDFIVLVGPSGCGKSTTLRMIAGLEDITTGDLYIDGRYANKLEPKERGAAMVFQNYALYPHMSVYDNMAFGLSGFPKEEIKDRIKAAAGMLQITELLDRKPTALSGGQCQRVALGRAVVRKSPIFLLDEPLSNLDAKLRVQMRSELIKLHENLGNTMIYVTHDQTEAMTMATRIVVMKRGLIQQVGTPSEVYRKPANVFVATFIGSPTMNVIEAVYKKGRVRFSDGQSIALPKSEVKSHDDFYAERKALLEKEVKDLREEERKRAEARASKVRFLPLDFHKEISSREEELDSIADIIKTDEHQIFFGIRPENIELGTKDGALKSDIVFTELLGADYHLHLAFNGGEIIAKVPTGDKPIEKGPVRISFKPGRSHLFDFESELRII
jgi:multiple sugar transport system ATP-binding protein